MLAECTSSTNYSVRGKKKKKQARKQLAGTQQPFMSYICYQFPMFGEWFTSELCICGSIFMWCRWVNALRVL